MPTLTTTPRRGLLAVLGALCLALTLACSGWLGGDAAKAPPRGASAVDIDIPRSTVDLPLVISASSLERQLTAQIPTVLLDKKGIDVAPKVLADVEVKRTGDPKLVFKKGKMRIDVPVSVKGRARTDTKRSKQLATLNGALTIRVHLTPTIGDDWELDGNTKVDHTWTKTPKIKAGPVKVDVKKKLDPLLKKELKKVAREIDKELAKQDPVRKRAAKAWKKLGKPMKLGGKPPAWLRIAPESLSASNLVAKSDGLHVDVSLQGTFSVHTGQAPAALKPGALPANAARKASSGTQLSMPVHVKWAQLKGNLEKALVGKRRTVDAGGVKATVVVTEIIDVYPSDDSVAVGVIVKIKSSAGDLQVKAWLTGQPVLKGSVLRISKFRYTAASDAVWVNAAHKLVAEDLRKHVASKLSVPLDRELDKAKDKVNAGLASGRAKGDLTLSGKMNRLTLKDVHVTDKALVVEALLRGSLSAEVK